MGVTAAGLTAGLVAATPAQALEDYDVVVQTPSGPIVWKDFPVTPELYRSVAQKVLSSLRDPTTALFTQTFSARLSSQGLLVVCGGVNGKNGFGGYAGTHLFDVSVKNDQFFDVHVDGPGTLGDLSSVTCSHIGAHFN